MPPPPLRYLLVHTDGPRLLMLRCSDWGHVRDFYGLPVEQFHQPCAAWHRDGHYVYVAAAGAKVTRGGRGADVGMDTTSTCAGAAEVMKAGGGGGGYIGMGSACRL